MRTILTIMISSLVLATIGWLVLGRNTSAHDQDAVSKACGSAITALQANQNAVDASDDLGSARDQAANAGRPDIASALDELSNTPAGSRDDRRATALRLLGSLCAKATASP